MRRPSERPCSGADCDVLLISRTNAFARLLSLRSTPQWVRDYVRTRGGVKQISPVPSTRSWIVQIRWRKRTTVRNFAWAKNGGKWIALVVAGDWRNACLARIGKPVTEQKIVAKQDNNRSTGILGVSVNPNERCATAHWCPQPREIKTKKFFFAMHGRAGAIRRATEFRRRKMSEIFAAQRAC